MSNHEYKTGQEQFWAGEFGSEYVKRNQDQALLSSNIALFSKIFERTKGVETILELGANVGMNIKAIQKILPDINLSAIEINKDAYNQLKEISHVDAHLGSILDFNLESKYDFIFTKGVLIHINPDELSCVYEKMVSSSNKYICVIEYYNPSPVEIEYRGNHGKLFKRDFAGELLDGWDLELVDYGFIYHRDPVFPQDDLTWFLMQKRN